MDRLKAVLREDTCRDLGNRSQRRYHGEDSNVFLGGAYDSVMALNLSLISGLRRMGL